MLTLKRIPSAEWASRPFMGPQVVAVDEQNRLGFWNGSGYAPASPIADYTAAQLAALAAAGGLTPNAAYLASDDVSGRLRIAIDASTLKTLWFEQVFNIDPPSSAGSVPIMFISGSGMADAYNYSATAEITFSSLMAWVCAISNGALRVPFLYRDTGTIPLVGDGSYGSPSVGAATINAAGCVPMNSWSLAAANNNQAACASAVCNEVMAVGELFSGGRKGYLLLNLYQLSTASGGGLNTAESELDYTEACVNKVLAAGWIPILLTPYANTSITGSAANSSAAQAKLARITEGLMVLAAKYPDIVVVDCIAALGIKTGFYADYFQVNFTPATPNGIRDLTLCQASQNPEAYVGTTSRFLMANSASLEQLSPLGTVTLACAVWDTLAASARAPKFQAWRSPMTRSGDQRYWGPDADSSGNPLMTGSASVSLSGTVLAGTAPTGYTFTNQNTNSPTGGMTPSIGRDIYGRSYLRMSLNMTWGSGGSVYSTGTVVNSSTSGALTNPPAPGTWWRTYARLKVHDTCNNIAGFTLSVDPYGSQPTGYGLRYYNNQQTPWLAPLRGREVLIETAPRQWLSAMLRMVPAVSLFTPDAALAVSGGIDLFELGSRTIAEWN